MVERADIKRDLPNFPDEVIDEWLLRLSNRADTGWPPPEILGTHAWAYIIVKPLTWWRQVDWNLETVDCSFENLSAGTRSIVHKMCDAQINGTQLPFYSDEETRDRFRNAYRQLMIEGLFQKPLVGIRNKTGLSILDGNHRVSALYASGATPNELLQKIEKGKPTKMQKVWIGSHRGGEALED